MKSSSCLLGWLGNALLLHVAVAAEIPLSDRETPAPVDEVAPLPGVFNTELPRTVWPEELRISLRPHFGDFLHHDYFRTTVGLRYGLTPQWELNSDVETYIAHGLGGAQLGEKLGVSTVRLGVKYKFSEFLLPYWETAAGINYSFPIGNPPEELADGLHHLTPYMTLEHKWEGRPGFSTFVSYGMDFITGGRVNDVVSHGDISPNTWFITPGVVWKKGAFRYTVETTFSSTLGLDSEATYRITLRPGVRWILPPALTFHSRSHWTVGVGFHADYGSNGTDFGTSLRLQTDFDFKRFFKRPSWDNMSVFK